MHKGGGVLPPLNSSYRGKNLRINSYFGKFFWRPFFWSSLGIQRGGGGDQFVFDQPAPPCLCMYEPKTMFKLDNFDVILFVSFRIKNWLFCVNIGRNEMLFCSKLIEK